MAKVFLTSAASTSVPPRWDRMTALRALEQMAARDRFGTHQVVDSAQAADIVLFVETHHDDSGSGPFFEWIFRHPAYRQFPEKVFVHSGMDNIVPLLRGIFPSIESRYYDPARMRSGPYLMLKNELLDPSVRTEVDPTLLGSFIGCARTVQVRHQLLKVRHDRLLIRDNGDAFIGAVKAKEKDRVDDLKKQYVDSLLASKFIICPRGMGASSIRLFETMEVGRVPVILSDAWVEPAGPNWNEFSIRIAERDVNRVPEIILAAEPRWEKMAVAARAAWEEYYADPCYFHRITEDCLALQKASNQERRVPTRVKLQLLRPAHLRRYLRSAKKIRSAPSAA